MHFNTFKTFLQSLSFHSLVDSTISQKDYIALDLSVNNSELKTINVSCSNHLEAYIWNHIKSHNAKIAFGGYLEKRSLYKRSSYFNKNNEATERNIHLGIDLWVKANTAIYAPLDGEIHSFNNNTNYGDYGPTLILKHSFKTFVFYTLYGHLSLESIEAIEVGVEVKQGEQIATLGTAKINGDYPPHLHFQIIKDIQNFKGDYPGVSNLLDLEFYKHNCPNPNLLLKLVSN